MRRIGLILVVLGLVLNQWTLSLVYPANGMHFLGLLEKSLGKWGLASRLLILTNEIVLVGFGLLVIKFHDEWKKGVHVLITLFLAGVLSFAALEIVTRLLTGEGVFSPFIQLRPYNKMNLTVALNGVAPFARNTTNKWGFRGDDPPANWDDYTTIVAVGGSTTQCFYLDDSKTWPYLLQTKLRKEGEKAWVGNAGISGHSSRAHMIFVRDIIPKIRPKIVLVLCGINDLWYSLDENAKKVEYSPETVGWKNKLLGYSRLVQVLYLWKIILWDDVVVLEKGGNVNFTPEPIHNELMLSGNVDTLLPSLPLYEKDIHGIIGELRKQKIRPIFMTQPVLFDTTSYWKTIAGWEYSYSREKGTISAATYARLLAAFNVTLVNVCRDEQVELFDLAAHIPHSRRYFYDVMHFTETGADTVAGLVASYLVLHPR